MALSEAWRVQFAVSAQRSGFETRAIPLHSAPALNSAAVPNSEAAGTQLEDLPDELLSKILEHCNTQQKCCLAQVCGRLLRLASQQLLWRSETPQIAFKRAIALCMSSILHLPPQVSNTLQLVGRKIFHAAMLESFIDGVQVIPVIIDSQRSERFVIRCPMHSLRFLLAAWWLLSRYHDWVL